MKLKWVTIGLMVVSMSGLTGTTTAQANAKWHRGVPAGLKGTWVSNKRYKVRGGNGHFRWRLWVSKKSVSCVAGKDALIRGTAKYVKYRKLAHHKYQFRSYVKEWRGSDPINLYYHKGHMTIIPGDGFSNAKMHKISRTPFK